jgi:hypothetical protein
MTSLLFKEKSSQNLDLFQILRDEKNPRVCLMMCNREVK